MDNVNNKELSDVFDISDSSEAIEITEEITPEDNKVEDPDVILQNNIDKANTVLDKIIDNIDTKLTVGMAEATASIVNSITNAVDKMYAGSFNFENVQIKKQMVELEEKKLFIKDKALEMKGQKGDIPRKQENILIADREAVMALFKDKDVVKKIEKKMKGEYNGKKETD